MKRCLCGKHPKDDNALVCHPCWEALPAALRDKWHAARTLLSRRRAAYNLIKWVFDNRREKKP